MPTSSQGISITGLPGELTNVRVRTSFPAPSTANNKVDASTLALDDGDDRVYVTAPLIDVGSESETTTTVSCQFLSTTVPTAGDEVEISGAGASGTFICTEAEVEYAVGELVKGTATYVNKPA